MKGSTPSQFNGRQCPAFAAMLLLGISFAATASGKDISKASFTGKLSRVIDGDTFVLTTADGSMHTIRLQDIDAPERGQPYGTQARDALVEILQTKEGKLSLKVHGYDRYRREIAEVTVGRTNVNRWLVRQGHAHVWVESHDAILHAAEKRAQQQHLGLWHTELPIIPPWDYRRAR